MGRFDGYRKVDLDYVKRCENGTEFLIHYVGCEWVPEYADKIEKMKLSDNSSSIALVNEDGWTDIVRVYSGLEFDIYEAIEK